MGPMKKILTLTGLAALVLALTSFGVAPTQAQPDTQVTVTVPADAAPFELKMEPTGGVLRAPENVGTDWVTETLAEAGITSPVPVRLIPEGTCGGAIAWGCTKVSMHPGTRIIATVSDVWVDADIIGTPLGKHVLLHEVGHANGIVDECAADQFANAHGSNSEFNRC